MRQIIKAPLRLGSFSRASVSAQLALGKSGSKKDARQGELRSQGERRGAKMGLLYWIVVGLIAGWLAGKVMRGGGYGVVIDIVLGILGGIVGGWGVWDARHLARRRHSWLDHRRVCWRGDSGMDRAKT